MKRSYGLLAGLTLVAMVCAQTVCALTVVYVTTNGTGDGSSWISATNSIQGAIDVIEDTNPTNTVAVSNGVYNIGAVTGYPEGATASNRVAIYKAITVRAASSDPADTIIEGVQVLGEINPGTNGPGAAAVRCVYMTNGASLIGITVSNGATSLIDGLSDPNESGGGIWSETTNSVISNCVLTANLANRYGGGARKGTLFDCVVRFNTAGYTGGRGGGGTYQATANNCQIVSNRVIRNAGGGMHGGKAVDCFIYGNTVGSPATPSNSQGGGFGAGGILIGCTVVSNIASDNISQEFGGGVGGSTGNSRPVYMTNCIVFGNRAGNGGGITGATAIDCLISENSCRDGGGARYSTLINCMVVDNSFRRRGGGLLQSDAINCNILSNIQTSGSAAVEGGAGASGHSGIPSVLTNCLLAANSAIDGGGGASRSTLYNCTIVNNSASGSGGGVDDSTVTNCISFGNNGTDTTVVAAYSMGVGYPLVDGNITNDPLFIDSGAGNYRLDLENSPCVNTGTNLNWTADDVDLDGNPRLLAGTVDMGAYESPQPPGTVITVD